MTTIDDATGMIATGVGVGIMAAGAMIPIKMLDNMANKKKRKKTKSFPKMKI